MSGLCRDEGTAVPMGPPSARPTHGGETPYEVGPLCAIVLIDGARPRERRNHDPTTHLSLRSAMTFYASLFVYLQLSLGYQLARLLDPARKLSYLELAASSAVLGTIVSTFIALLLLLATGSWNASLALLWAGLGGTGLKLLYDTYRGEGIESVRSLLPSKLFTLHTLLFMLVAALYVAVVVGVLYYDREGFPRAVVIGWGDSAYHLGMIERLKTAEPFILEEPVAAGTRLNYPFIVNLMSALYERVGFGKPAAWNLPLLLCGLAFVALLYGLGRRVLGRRWLALGLVVVVLYGAGTGYVWYVDDVHQAFRSGGAAAALETALDPPHEYTHLDTRTGGKEAGKGAPVNIVWIVPAISFLSHQRTFPVGASLGMLVLLGVLLYRGDTRLYRWGAAWGLLPFCHSHTFLAVSLVLAVWFLFDVGNWTSWLKAALLGTAFALPQVLYLVPGPLFERAGGGVIRPWFGWMMCDHRQHWLRCDPATEGVDTNPLWFWTKNFGFVFWSWLLALAAPLLLKGERRRLFLSTALPSLAASAVLFVVTNTFIFQPWAFDNNKIIFWWWITAGVAVLALVGTVPRSWARGAALLVFLAASTPAGFIDVAARVGHFTAAHYGYWGEDALRVTRWIRAHTAPNDVFLTGDGATIYVPMLTGRPIYLGYPGWLWTHGKNAVVSSRTKRAKRFLYEGDPAAVCRDGVKYVLWDGKLLHTYPHASRDKVSSSTRRLFRISGDEEVIEVLEIKCPTKKAAAASPPR